MIKPNKYVYFNTIYEHYVNYIQYSIMQGEYVVGKVG